MKLCHIYSAICIIMFSVLCVHADNDRVQDAHTMSAMGPNSHEQDIPPVKRGNLDMPEKSVSEDERMEHKRNLAKDLVHKAVNFFKNNSVESAAYAFSELEEWQIEEMYVFIIHQSGTIYAHGKDTDLIWRNINDVKQERQKTSTGIQDDLIQAMREADRHDGWLDYEWNFENKHVYVQRVEKDGRVYFLGTGFYPESHRYLAKQLVDRAVRYAQEHGADQAFQRINNPIGVFVQGPVYLWAYDFDGMSYAHGNNIGRVGRQHMDWQGVQGRYIIRDIVEKLQNQEHVWIEYYATGNVLKRDYVRRFTDPKSGKRYFIGGGYYPEVDFAMVKGFVRDAVNHLKSQGPKIALRDFTSYTGGFRKGPLRIFVYDMNGVILADGQNPEFVGQNMLSVTDPEGRSVAKEILKKARKFGEGKTTLLTRNEYQDLYYQKVNIPDGTYIVGSGYWPDSKQSVAESLVQKAVTNLEQKSIEHALRDFTTMSSEYLRGDLFIEVIDYNGIVVVYGPRNPYVWSRLDVTTDKGYKVSDVLIETARAAGRAGGWVQYRSQGRMYHMYVAEVAKEIDADVHGETYLKRYAVGVFYL